MSTERHCPKCSKRLRSNNTRGVCKDCWDKGERLTEGDVVDRLDLGAVQPPPKPRKGSSATARMRVVADALGLDGEQLLEAYAAAWLATLQAKVVDEP